MQIHTIVIQADGNPKFYMGIESHTGPTIVEAMDQCLKAMIHSMRNEGIREPFRWCIDHYDNSDAPYSFDAFCDKVRMYYGPSTRIHAFVNSF